MVGVQDHGKHFESFYTELSSRDMSLTDLEIQNNNSGYGWTHQTGMICTSGDLAGLQADHLDTSLSSDQSNLNLSFDGDEKFGGDGCGRGHQLVVGVGGGVVSAKKGRGGRKKSAR